MAKSTQHSGISWHEWAGDELAGPEDIGVVYADGWVDDTTQLAETIAQLGWLSRAKAAELANPYALRVGNYGYLEGESEPVICNGSGETSTGETVEITLKMTYCVVPGR